MKATLNEIEEVRRMNGAEREFMVTLAARTGTLTLSTNAGGWCHVILRMGDATYELGADTAREVVARLRRGLDRTRIRPAVGVIGGTPVVHVCSLYENHWRVYAAERPDGFLLFFEDDLAQTVLQLPLDEVERDRWESSLAAWVLARSTAARETRGDH